MEEIERELCGLGRNPSSALVSTFRNELVVAAAHDVAVADGIAAADEVAAIDGIVATDGVVVH